MIYPRHIELRRAPGTEATTIVLHGSAQPPADQVTFAARSDAYRALAPLLRDEWLQPHEGHC